MSFATFLEAPEAARPTIGEQHLVGFNVAPRIVGAGHVAGKLVQVGRTYGTGKLAGVAFLEVGVFVVGSIVAGIVQPGEVGRATTVRLEG